MTFDVMQRNDRRRQDRHVLRFRPRTSTTLPGQPAREISAKAGGHQPDDFRHRMWVNVAGLACAALLTICGIWLASRMADVRQTQDCVLSGRRNCAPVVAIDRQALPLRQH